MFSRQLITVTIVQHILKINILPYCREEWEWLQSLTADQCLASPSPTQREFSQQLLTACQKLFSVLGRVHFETCSMHRSNDYYLLQHFMEILPLQCNAFKRQLSYFGTFGLLFSLCGRLCFHNKIMRMNSYTWDYHILKKEPIFQNRTCRSRSFVIGNFEFRGNYALCIANVLNK